MTSSSSYGGERKGFHLHAVHAVSHGGDLPSMAIYRRQTMKKRILIVDDDEWVRSLLRELFQDSGYQVWDAGDGESACVLFSKHFKEIDIVTLDLDLPGIDGVETFHRLKSLHPDIKIIIISGSQNFAHFKPPRVPLVQKPFSTAQLLTCIHELAH